VHESARPQRRHQFVLADHVPGALDQQHQRVENLGRQRDRLATHQQAAFADIQFAIGEAMDRIFLR